MNPIKFPLRLTDNEGEVEYYANRADLECNLEHFNSQRDSDSELVDADNRAVFLDLDLTVIRELRLLDEIS